MDLQYLPEDKKREEDPDIRKMLLESLFLVAQMHTTRHRQCSLLFSLGGIHCMFLVQLTATMSGRQMLKDKNVYPIIRELHQWERDVHVGASCEKLIQVAHK